MTQKMALVPEQMIPKYKPEYKVYENIHDLLEDSNLVDDSKVKLLSQLLSRYKRLTHAPKEPVPVTVVPKKTDISPFTETDIDLPQQEVPASKTVDELILLSVPQLYQKYVPHILQMLKSHRYEWDDQGQLIINNLPILNTHIVDLMSYLMRNRKSTIAPEGFMEFWEGIKKANVPKEWIGNKILAARIGLAESPILRIRPPRISPVTTKIPVRKTTAKKHTSRSKKRPWKDY